MSYDKAGEIEILITKKKELRDIACCIDKTLPNMLIYR